MPKRTAGSSGGKAKKPKAPKPDWRVPIFFWRGKVRGDTWHGTWVASEDGLPSDEEFAASLNAFALKSDTPITGQCVLDCLGSYTFTGSYKLDQGEGLADYSDVTHKVCVIEGPPLEGGQSGWCIVGARGTTEFGEFVSLGRYDGHSGSGDVTLTLARRYIADNDPRCKMSAEEVAGRLDVDEELDWTFSECPWGALPWKVPEDWPAGLEMTKEIWEKATRKDWEEATVATTS